MGYRGVFASSVAVFAAAVVVGLATWWFISYLLLILQSHLLRLGWISDMRTGVFPFRRGGYQPEMFEF